MTTANAINALAAGADFVDVTVNGLGERAGNAALEEAATVKNQNRPLDPQIFEHRCTTGDNGPEVNFIA